jgi:UDP-N-acetylmuramoyl-L-alanyl-D-glutamate--2,6-diaminopimelate ligase
VRLSVTACEDVAGARDRVGPAERDAALAVLREEGLAFGYEAKLADAVRRILEGTTEGDQVLLLGAQGMDAAAGMVNSALRSAAWKHSPGCGNLVRGGALAFPRPRPRTR